MEIEALGELSEEELIDRLGEVRQFTSQDIART